MKVVKRVFISLTIFCSCMAVVLLCVGFGTKFWIQSGAKRLEGFAFYSNTNVTTDATTYDRFTGTVHFGLLEGETVLNFGLGSRTSTFNIKEEYDKDENFIDFKLWVATIVTLSLAILFGVIGGGFSILNVVSNPIEWITGIGGLYVWNTVAGVFNLTCVILWVVLFYTKFKDNVMTKEDKDKGWNSADQASFGYSFWIVVGAMFFYVVNCVLVYLSSREPEFQRRTNAVVNEKPADGIIMLY